MFARTPTVVAFVDSPMSAIPRAVETDRQPPMSVPLRHFVVGLGFLLGCGVVGVLGSAGVVPSRTWLARVHLLLVGWVCVTIMGAMTQFVPVWSGRALHSERLATVQLPLVTVGLLGFVGCLLVESYALLPVFGCAMAAGFWTFAYNVGRTLLDARPWDVTERHFAVAVGFLVVVTTLGPLLAVGYARPALGGLPVGRTGLRTAHATVGVFGVVLTTVFGALYQLGTMFTGTELDRVDRALGRIEEVGHPVGVAALALGRLFDVVALGRVGALLVAVSVFAFGVVLARRLRGATVPWNAMLRRYAVVAGAMLSWAALTLPVWAASPLDPAALFGAPSATALLFVGVVGFVVWGTLYHVVPFVVWVHRYSDRLGLGDVPTVADLYDDRLAATDFAALSVGGSILVLAESVGLPDAVVSLGGVLVFLGVVVFVVNVLSVVYRHGRGSSNAPSVTADERRTAGDAVDRDSREGSSV
ncbi:hypothetical protein [Candidatus Halobonum tyrrellensis]|nr:hypothetical protein [Candidatus Halobonum tyrrellensis]